MPPAPTAPVISYGPRRVPEVSGKGVVEVYAGRGVSRTDLPSALSRVDAVCASAWQARTRQYAPAEREV